MSEISNIAASSVRAHENAAGICLIDSHYLCKSALQKLHVLVKKFARPMSGLELVSLKLY
jgi:hypothetical protein